MHRALFALPVLLALTACLSGGDKDGGPITETAVTEGPLTTQRGSTSQSSSCSSTRRRTASPATLQPSTLCGAGKARQSLSANWSMFSRNTAPCAKSTAPGWGEA